MKDCLKLLNKNMNQRQFRNTIASNPVYMNHSNQKLISSNGSKNNLAGGNHEVTGNNSHHPLTPLNNRRLSHQVNLCCHTNNNHRSQTSSQNKEKQITVMLMAISISFMILSFPYSTYELLRRLNVTTFTFLTAVLKNRNTSRFVLLLLDIKHATNFILYCLTGQKFRSELKSLLMQCFRPERYREEFKASKNYASQMTSLNGNIVIRRVNDDRNY